MHVLGKQISFPAPHLASEEGLLAIGGDLSEERLIFAYQNGIFPWYNEGEPILWWSPDPRFVLFPNEIRITKSMRQVIRKGIFEITFDKAFDTVITNCSAAKRRGQAGTWLVPDMILAYNRLHQLGIAHSVEAWSEGELVGGLYGIAIGKCFFGESMFSHQSNASKAALIFLAQSLEEQGFEIIDCQSYTSHLASMGARFIPRSDFLAILDENKKHPIDAGGWAEI